MRVLFISSFLLFPESRSGGAKRLYYLARALEQEAEIAMICFDAAEESASFAPAAPPFPRFLQVRYTRSLRAKFGDPFDVPRYLAPAMAQELDDFIRAARPDVVLCAFPFALSLVQLPALRECRNVVYLEDDLSFETFRERVRTARSLPRRVHQGIRLWQAESFYRRLLPRARSFIAISEEEAAIIRRKFPHLEVVIVGYGIPLEEYPALEPPANGLVLGFIGNYIHAANTDAVRHFLHEWYPALRANHPAARVQLAGKNLPAELAEPWRDDPQISFLSNVPDLREFYAGISIFVNPIVSQRGLRTKLVEAAAFARPIISTTLGAEGLGDLPLLRADSAAEFVQAFAALQPPASLREHALAARAAAERCYSIEAISRPLAQCLARSTPQPA